MRNLIYYSLVTRHTSGDSDEERSILLERTFWFLSRFTRADKAFTSVLSPDVLKDEDVCSVGIALNEWKQRTQQYADNSFFIRYQTGKLKTRINICNSNDRKKTKKHFGNSTEKNYLFMIELVFNEALTSSYTSIESRSQIGKFWRWLKTKCFKVLFKFMSLEARHYKLFCFTQRRKQENYRGAKVPCDLANLCALAWNPDFLYWFKRYFLSKLIPFFTSSLPFDSMPYHPR